MYLRFYPILGQCSFVIFALQFFSIGASQHKSTYEEAEMKQNALLSSCLLIAAVLIFSGIAPVQAQRDTAAAKGNLITVLNPAVTEKLAERVPLASRLAALEGKTIYLVDLNYEGIGGTPVMMEMQTWFAKNMPKVKAIYKLKSGNYVADDPALWKEMATSRADAVIFGVAG
jgi:hypothetical protein